MIFSHPQIADCCLRSFICRDFRPCPFLESADLSPTLLCSGVLRLHGLDHLFVEEFLQGSSQDARCVGDSTCAKSIAQPISGFCCRDLPIAPRMRQQYLLTSQAGGICASFNFNLRVSTLMLMSDIQFCVLLGRSGSSQSSFTCRYMSCSFMAFVNMLYVTAV